MATSTESEEKEKVSVASKFLGFINNQLFTEPIYHKIENYIELTQEKESVASRELPATIIYNFYSSGKYVEKEYAIQDEEVELYFIKRLSNFKEVEAIYSHKYLNNTLIFTILLDIDKYEDSLMNKLYETEYYVQKKFSNQSVDFNYLPLIEKDKGKLINPSYKLIFKQNAFSKTSFITSQAQRGTSEGIETVSFLQGLAYYNEFLRSCSLYGIQAGERG